MPDVVQDILFKIGTVGVGQATGQIGSFTAKLVKAKIAISAITAGLKAVSESGDEFRRLVKNLTIDQEEFNKSTNGLIDTFEGWRGATRLQNLEFDVSSKQFAAIGKAAVYMNRQLGNGPEGSTKIFNQLVSSVEKGNERALRQFGIQLDETTDKAKAGQEALDKLTAKFGDMSFEAETATEKAYAFKNSFDTVTAALNAGTVENMTNVLANLTNELLGGGNALTEFEQDVIATNGAIATWQMSLDGLQWRMEKFYAQLFDNKHVLELLNDEYERRLELMTRIASKQRQLAKINKENEQFDQARDWLDRYKDADRLAFKSGLKGQEKERAISELEKIMRLAPRGTGFDIEGLVSSTRRKIQKRSKKRSGPVDDMSFSEAEAEEAYRRSVSPELFQAAGGIEARGAAFDTIGPQGRAAGAGAIEAQAAAARSARMAADEEALKLAKERDEKERQLIIAQEQEKLEIRKFFLGEERRLEEMNIKERYEMMEESGNIGLKFIQNIGSAQDAENKKGFERQKRWEYAANMTQTFLSATSAFRSVMQSAIPFPANVAAAGALSASVIAAGARRGQKIRNQKFSGGGGGDAGSNIGANLGGSDLAPSGGSNSYTFNLMLSGQTVWKEMVNENQLQQQSGEKSFAMMDK